jgi:Mn-dependent DtxR family transcriptional regulator
MRRARWGYKEKQSVHYLSYDDRKALELLRLVYAEGEGNLAKGVSFNIITDKLGVDILKANSLATRLHNRGLIIQFIGGVSITEKGIELLRSLE